MKKLVSLLLIIVILGMVGCTSQTPEEPTDIPAEEPAGETPADTTSDEPVVLSMVMKDLDPGNEVHQAYIDRIESGLADEGVNVEIEVVEMAQGNYAENLGLMLLGGDIPDLIYFQGGDEQMADQGILEDLTPYIDNSPVIKDAMLAHQAERVENYPYLLWIKPMATKVPVVRSDFFAEMETSEALMADPTVDNYYAFFQEMAEEHTDYAYTVPGALLEIDTIFNNAFGVTGTWVEQEGAYVYGKVTDMEKEKLDFYRKLYAEELLDPEYLTKAWDTKEQAFYSNTVGVIAGTSGKVIDIYDGNMKSQNGPEATLTVLPPASGVAQGYYPVSVTKETRGMAISSLSEHKDVAWQVLEFLASDEGQFIDRLGFEGDQYNVVDGKIELTEQAQNWFAFFFEVPSWQPEMELETPLLGEPAEESLEMAVKYYVADTDVTLPAELAPQMDAVNNLYNEFAADYITGKIGPDAWEAFVADWYALGGEDLTAYANEYLD